MCLDRLAHLVITALHSLCFCRYVKDPSLFAGTLAVPNGGAGGHVTGNGGWRRTGSDGIIPTGATPTAATTTSGRGSSGEGGRVGNEVDIPIVQVIEN